REIHVVCFDYRLWRKAACLRLKRPNSMPHAKIHTSPSDEEPMKVFAQLAAAFVVFLFSISSCLATEEGKPAPSLEAKLIDGKPFSLSGERGHVVIINFWATWCPPCREEMPALETYYSRHKDEGLRIIAISMDDPQDAAKVR